MSRAPGASLLLVILAACAGAACAGADRGVVGPNEARCLDAPSSPLPVVGLIPDALRAVEAAYGSPQRYFEVSADSRRVGVIVAVDDATAAEQAFYCGAARVLRVYPLGPVQQGSGLNLPVLSTMGRMCLGAMACREMVPGIEDLASGFVEATAALKSRAERETRR